FTLLSFSRSSRSSLSCDAKRKQPVMSVACSFVRSEENFHVQDRFDRCGGRAGVRRRRAGAGWRACEDTRGNQADEGRLRAAHTSVGKETGGSGGKSR